MATPLHTTADHNGQGGGESQGAGMEKSLALLQALQTSLDTEQLITTFATHAGNVVPLDGLGYCNPNLELEHQVGEQARHSCTYRLTVGDEGLGELTFRRRRKFSDSETGLLENLLCNLLHPLRNALLYRHAVLLAQRDPLTGTYNRAAMDDTLPREIELAKRHDTALSLLVLDIDHFKTINDTYGHTQGDCVLRAIAGCAQAAIRCTDMLFRYGGEEFVVLLRNTDGDGAELLAERIRERIAQLPCHCGDEPVPVTVSVGVASLRAGEGTLDLFRRADRALYQAKQGGRNRVHAH